MSKVDFRYIVSNLLGSAINLILVVVAFVVAIAIISPIILFIVIPGLVYAGWQYYKLKKQAQTSQEWSGFGQRTSSGQPWTQHPNASTSAQQEKEELLQYRAQVRREAEDIEAVDVKSNDQSSK